MQKPVGEGIWEGQDQDGLKLTHTHARRMGIGIWQRKVLDREEWR
jgi:hypothetical protein